MTRDPEKGKDIVEGDVDQHLRALHSACGGLDATWDALVHAPDESIHSIDEYRAAFSKRFPTCKFDGTGTASSALGSKPKLNKKLAPLANGVATGKPGGKLGSKAALPAALFSAKAPTRSSITVGAHLPSAAKPVIEGLAKRQLVRDAALHNEVMAAYSAALESLQLPVESLHDGTYAEALKKAKADLAAAVRKAHERHRQDSDKDIAKTRKSVGSDDARRVLDDLKADFAGSTKRLPAKKVEMPRSFWPRTVPAK